MVVGSLRQETQTAIIGAGPGGYVAAIRAASLGQEVVLIDDREQLGGTCLIEGCIPSKTLIHAVETIDMAQQAVKYGITFGELHVDINGLRSFSEDVVSSLSKGISGLLERRGVEVIKGRAHFKSDRIIAIDGADTAELEFENAIIATGSHVNAFPPAADLPVWTSREALQLPNIPERLLVVGGGYIGLELGLVYAGLGSHITLAEFFPRLLTGADEDLVKVVLRNCERRFSEMLLESRVTTIARSDAGYTVTIEHGAERLVREFDQVLVAVGRRANTEELGLEKTGVTVGAHGTIEVDTAGRTSSPHIFAIGDVTPGPMLAHKAAREAKVVAEVISGHASAFDNRAIPAVVFTDPEMAWAGLTEAEARQRNIEVIVGRFPLSALGRARTLGRTDGMVKVIADASSQLVLGVGMVGPQASELIAEGTLAIEMGATLEDLMVTIHPHPTLSEAIMEAAEVAAGMSTHVFK